MLAQQFSAFNVSNIPKVEENFCFSVNIRERYVKAILEQCQTNDGSHFNRRGIPMMIIGNIPFWKCRKILVFFPHNSCNQDSGKRLFQSLLLPKKGGNNQRSFGAVKTTRSQENDYFLKWSFTASSKLEHTQWRNQFLTPFKTCNFPRFVHFIKNQALCNFKMVIRINAIRFQ